MEKLNLRNEADYRGAAMDGSLHAELQVPVQGHAAQPDAAQPDAAPVDRASTGVAPATATGRITQSALGDDVATLGIAVGHADGALVEAKVSTTARLLNRLAGEMFSDALLVRLRSLQPTLSDCALAVSRLKERGDSELCRQLVQGLVEVAFADGILHDAELELIRRVGRGLAVQDGAIEALVQFGA